MKVLKFGGTSVGAAENIKRVADIIHSYQKQEESIIVVSSAMSGVTNLLIKAGELAEQGNSKYLKTVAKIEKKHADCISALLNGKNKTAALKELKNNINDLKEWLQGVSMLKELTPRVLDLIQSFGERLSVPIIAAYCNQAGVKAIATDSQNFIFTNNDFGKARVDFTKTNRAIRAFFKEIKATPIVTGFIAKGQTGQTTTLGRGGSDFTAAIIGAAMKAKEIEIWTDVDGVMTTDPRSVKNAFSLKSLSYLEAMEMSHFGAKVIYPPTLQPAFDKNIVLRIRNTFNPDFEGTRISSKFEDGGRLVKGISSIKNISMISLTGSGMIGVSGVASRLFSALAKHQVNLILITQASSEHSICFVIDPQDGESATLAIEEEFELEIERGKIDKPVVEVDKSIVAIIGENMRNTPGISSKLFSALGKNGINILTIAQGSSEVNISVVIDNKDLSKALTAVHQAFFESETKTINIFMIGVGLIGKTLLAQIKRQAQYLLDERLLEINIIALSNSKKMLFKADGIALGSWKRKLDAAREKANFGEFIDIMIDMNLPNSVFVDSTSNEEITKLYQKVLASSISIVTPNKLANSGSYIDYQKLQKEAFLHGVKFLYETNVGAGLPVISTMADLKASGDKILKIEGVLSGTLSYIFNSFTEGSNFSEIVAEAKAKGFTEPDPRDDLNGMDVARKILILARETGLSLEPKDIIVENILPESCVKAKTVDQFFTALKKANPYFEDIRNKAAKGNKKLRFIATLEKGKAQVSLKAVGEDHPFYGLSGSDNIIAFTTMRYYERPLVIKGPGAGAEVTAAGVFSEIISVSNYLYQGIKNSLPNGQY